MTARNRELPASDDELRAVMVAQMEALRARSAKAEAREE